MCDTNSNFLNSLLDLIDARVAETREREYDSLSKEEVREIAREVIEDNDIEYEVENALSNIDLEDYIDYTDVASSTLEALRDDNLNDYIEELIDTWMRKNLSKVLKVEFNKMFKAFLMNSDVKSDNE